MDNAVNFRQHTIIEIVSTGSGFPNLRGTTEDSIY